MRRIPFAHTLNTRDLGGYAVSLTQETAYGVLLRSDVPHKLEAHEIAFLLERNITTSIDLRREEELDEYPSMLKDREGFTYHHVSLMGDTRLRDFADDIPAAYYAMVEEWVSLIQVMRIIADAPGGVLFHCAVGKDRTGVVAALLLLLAGVPRIDVVADYQVTETYIAPLMRKYAALYPEFPVSAARSSAEYMEGFLKRFFAAYASVEAFLLDGGLTPNQVAALRGKLLRDG